MTLRQQQAIAGQKRVNNSLFKGYKSYASLVKSSSVEQRLYNADEYAISHRLLAEQYVSKNYGNSWHEDFVSSGR